jgi:hypothetical protein
VGKVAVVVHLEVHRRAIRFVPPAQNADPFPIAPQSGKQWTVHRGQHAQGSIRPRQVGSDDIFGEQLERGHTEFR